MGYICNYPNTPTTSAKPTTNMEQTFDDSSEPEHTFVHSSVKYNATTFVNDRIDEIYQAYWRLKEEVTVNGLDLLHNMDEDSFVMFVVQNSKIRPLGKHSRSAKLIARFDGPQKYVDTRCEKI